MSDARVGQRALAIHRDVERDDGERLGKVADADDSGGNGEDSESDPERGSFHTGLLACGRGGVDGMVVPCGSRDVKSARLGEVSLNQDSPLPDGSFWA